MNLLNFLSLTHTHTHIYIYENILNRKIKNKIKNYSLKFIFELIINLVRKFRLVTNVLEFVLNEFDVERA